MKLENIFKRKNNKESYDVITARYKKQVYRNRVNRIKSIIFSIVLFFGLLGGYKSLFKNSESSNSDDSMVEFVEVSAFAEAYVQYYFSNEYKTSIHTSFPVGKEYIDKELEVEDIQDISVFQIQKKEDIFEVNVEFVLNEQQTYTTLLIEKHNNSYYVSNTLLLLSTEVNEEYLKEEIELEGQNVSSEELEVLQNILKSYYTAKNKDAESEDDSAEARLFYDKDTTVLYGSFFDVDNIKVEDAKKQENNIYSIKYSVIQEYGNIRITNNFIAEINKDSNKIIQINYN